MLPNFLGIGPGRCGTTWVYRRFKDHPEVFLSSRKEVQFFDRHYDNGVSWYESFFDEADGQAAVGEISPSYFPNASSAERIRTHLPDVKLFTILRNPCDRAMSSYTGYVLNGDVSASLSIFDGCQYLEQHCENFTYQPNPLETGFYAKHLSRVLEHFPAEQVKVLWFDDLKSQPEAFYRELCEFLGISHEYTPENLAEPEYQGYYSPLLRTLNVITRAVPIPLLRRKMESRIRRLRPKVASKRPELDPDVRRQLVDYYRDDIAELSRMTGRDLSHWV